MFLASSSSHRIHFRFYFSEAEDNVHGPTINEQEITGYYSYFTEDNSSEVEISLSFDDTVYPEGEICGVRANIRADQDMVSA